MRPLPPLNALRVFESVARNMSFSKAADELNVTPGAVSQQIKALEAYLGNQIIRRQKRGLLLTDEAQASLPALRDAFAQLADAAEILAQRANSGRLAISVAPSLASKWLVPRLDAFHDRHGDVEVWLSADMNVVDFAVDDVDLAIRYGAGDYAGLHVEKLMSETIVPVCSTRLLIGENALKTPMDICHHTLLHDGSTDRDESCPDWPMWLKAAGVTDIDCRRGPTFNQSSLVIEAAVAGRGIALAKASLALADLEAARLVIPFDMETPTDFAYYIVCPRSKRDNKAVRTFIRWLHGEATQSTAERSRRIDGDDGVSAP
ncbi:MAG: transcriptional regulator GcvA [Pseudomonadota bacterium]